MSILWIVENKNITSLVFSPLLIFLPCGSNGHLLPSTRVGPKLFATHQWETLYYTASGNAPLSVCIQKWIHLLINSKVGKCVGPLHKESESESVAEIGRCKTKLTQTFLSELPVLRTFYLIIVAQSWRDVVKYR